VGSSEERRTVAADTEAERVTAIGYVRGDAAQIDGELRRQAETIERLCARRGWDLVSLVRELGPAKGRPLKRPGLGGAMQRLAVGDATCLVVTDLRVLCRSVGELGDVLDALGRTSGRLVSLEPPVDSATRAGQVAMRILVAVSDWERTRTLERSRRGLAAAREQGATQPTIQPELKRQIARMRGAGMTLQAIVDVLNAEGVPTVRGGATWRPSSVQAAIGYRRPS
jgi:DNA invertase Pin-like site-specific DNA recombinase